MSKYRHDLPQLGEALFMTDAGLETTLVYYDGIDLPYFASFDLLKDQAGFAIVRRTYADYASVARNQNMGMVLESPTWRANPDWGTKLGYDARRLADANRRGIGLLLEIREEFETPLTPIVISGNLGPRGDGYLVETRMSADEAHDYHHAQIDVFATTDADLVSAFTMNYVEEAIGIVRAARDESMPVVISFTVETDGQLHSGVSLAHAIQRTDAETDGYPAYYMINCAHPTHFDQALREGGTWRNRIRGLRANASRRSHAELDTATEIDAGNPVELGAQYREMLELLPHIRVIGGCCGTDHRHVAAIGHACQSLRCNTPKAA